MEDIGYLWTFQEGVDELKQKLQYMTYELEMARKEANEEMKKSNGHIKQLFQLLQTACKERDDAKSQLKKLQLLVSLNTKPNFDKFVPITAPFSPDSPLLTSYPTKTNSGLTESSTENPQIQSKKSLSHSHSHVSSPVVDSLSYPQSVSSPDSVDQGNLVIDNLAKGRPLPPKGKLLQAVIEAGPLLQTLMVAGSLPRWRNPPGSVTHPIPPVNIRICESGLGTSGLDKNVANSNGTNLSTYGTNLSTYGDVCSGSMGIYTSPMLDFRGGSSMNFDCQIAKRQRLL